MRLIPTFAWLLTCAIVFAGCESGPKLPATAPAEGVVTLDGKPTADVTIIFIADQGTYNATDVTDKSRKFQMKAFEQKSGAVPGSYKVEFNKTIVETLGGKGGEPGVNLKYGVPQKYANMVTSGITWKVTEKGDKNIKFELVSK